MINLNQFKKNNNIKPPLIGEYIIKSHNKDYHFRIIEDNKEIWRYDDNEGIYKNDAEDIIKSITQDILGVYSKDYYIREVVKWFKNLRTKNGIVAKDVEYRIKRDDLDPNPRYICLKDCVFDLKNSKKVTFSYIYKLTRKLPVEYKKGAKSTVLNKFISSLFNNPDDRKVIQEMFGYTLWSDYNGNKAFILKGSGSNGKSTLLHVLGAMLGDENTTSVSLDDITGGSRFMAIELYGKMANISNELGTSALRNTKVFKEATGRDTMMGEKKGKDPIKFVNHAKLIFAVNNIPTSKDKSNAFYRRWVPVEFNNTFTGAYAKHNLGDKLTTNYILSAWFNWSVEGLDRLRKNNWIFTGGWTSKQVKNWWQYNKSHIYKFVRLNYEMDTNNTVKKKDVYADYKQFCNSESRVPLALNEFCKRVYDESPYQIIKKKKKIKRVWQGIKKK